MITRQSICHYTNRGHCRAISSSLKFQPAVRYSSTTEPSVQDFSELLSKPTWSVRSLLPTIDSSETPDINSKQLHHLLRLSALPPPKDAAEEREMLQTLQSQLHFVKKIQSVHTEGLEPLQSIHDETMAAREENEIKYEDLTKYMKNEERAAEGRMILKSRRGEIIKSNEAEGWSVLAQASRTVRKHFIVRSNASKE
jgi:Asp-tRNA(Asn)/Glu-tRNA(Gln) amidotransferase C subunit